MYEKFLEIIEKDNRQIGNGLKIYKGKSAKI